MSTPETRISGKLLCSLGIHVGSRIPNSGPLAWVAATLIVSNLLSPVPDVS